MRSPGALDIAHNKTQCKKVAAFNVPNRGARSHTIDANADGKIFGRNFFIFVINEA